MGERMFVARVRCTARRRRHSTTASSQWSVWLAQCVRDERLVFGIVGLGIPARNHLLWASVAAPPPLVAERSEPRKRVHQVGRQRALL